MPQYRPYGKAEEIDSLKLRNDITKIQAEIDEANELKYDDWRDDVKEMKSEIRLIKSSKKEITKTIQVYKKELIRLNGKIKEFI